MPGQLPINRGVYMNAKGLEGDVNRGVDIKGFDNFTAALQYG